MGAGTIKFRDAQNVDSIARIDGPTTHAALDTLAGALKTYSNAIWVETRMASVNDTPGSAGTDPWKSVEEKAVIMLRDTDTQKVVRVSIPAPIDSTVFDYNAGSGPRVKTTVGTAVATAMSTATGRTFSFLGGKLHGRPFNS